MKTELADLAFNKNNRINFPTKYHGEVSISKEKWDEICQEPERFYYRQNAEKVATTLINPDYVRHHKVHSTQFLYYKKFETIVIGNKETASTVKYWTIIVDNSTQRICTIYPTIKPKKGKEYKGEVS